MQHAVAVFDILFNARVIFIVIICGNRIPGTGKTNNCPFAADGADLGRFYCGHHKSGAALYLALDAGRCKGGNGQRKEDGKRQNQRCKLANLLHIIIPL